MLAQGFVMNMQPSEAEAGFDIRMPPTADPQLMRKIIEEQWAPAWRNMTYEVNSCFFFVLIVVSLQTLAYLSALD